MAKAAKKTGGRVISVDGSKMAGGGGSARVPEDDYRAKIAEIKQTESSAGDPMLVLTYQIVDGKYKGKKIIDRIVLTEKVLWKLRQVLEAMGKTVPSKLFKLNIDGLIGPEVAITVVDGEPYKGRIKSEISDVQSTDILDESDEEEEDDDDDDDDDDEELDEVDLDDEL